MKVTISDVARLAGVSTATVSHTINSTRYVSGETKEKVYRAIAELGYTPDASARSFRTGKKKTIGFIVPDISDKFFATMIESVENYLSAHGYHLIIANTKENPEREETNIRLLSAGLVDGLLIASTMEDFSRFESLIPAGFPVVLVDRTFDTKRFPSVSVSNFQPIYRSVCRLAGKGDKRIGMIGGLPRLSSTKERIAAYQEAVVDCGLPQDDLLIRYGNSMENSAQSCLDELLEQLRAQGVTDLNDVKYAVMETSGKLSVLLRSDCQPLTPRQLALTVEDDTFLPTVIINDGRVLADNLRQCGRDERWLEKELHRQGVKRSEDVFLLTVDQQGTVVCLRKEGAR